MSNPWDIKSDDSRSSDSLPVFIIFCEDEVSEPVYFKHFETDKFKINPIPNQKSMMTNVVNAISHCKDYGLIELIDGTPTIKEEKVEVWCVYDRDKEVAEKRIKEGDILFDEAIETARRNGINVAWSNDAFELWILLHFEDIDPTIIDTKFRIYYYDRLTDIFNNLNNPNEDLVKALAYSGFNYKQSLKSQTNFRNIVRPELLTNTSKAIKRAVSLEKNFSLVEKSEAAPCTMVHHLVQKLIEVGGKK
jgi:hypothetical protein